MLEHCAVQGNMIEVAALNARPFPAGFEKGGADNEQR
jgi:hypothetical protein